ncbi:MAG TPA: 3-hydroxybutyryl-CoA epimerase [Candidatus Faecousia intestinigallinarum]|nr:3-hydroxybutyryl-CoA epimerase [Candidatus Faecousia intestinigallinarum]
MRNAVVIVGSGMMGSGIGAMAALAGRRVILVDTEESRARRGRERAMDCIRLREENGLATQAEAQQAEALLEVSAELPSAVQEAAMVVEAIVENLEAKQNVFAQLDGLLPPEIPICSNTSGLQITQISALCTHPERTMTTHFWLPAHLVPLVEVVMGQHTSEAMAQRMVEELKRWKKAPVLVRRDLPGQLANRIFQAIIREAVDIVASGLASAEDVDTAISCGMAMRFPEWGPLKHLDAIGLQLGLSVQDSVLPNLCAEAQAGTYLRQLVADGKLGVSSGSGFYDWSARSIDEDMRKRDQFIIGAVKLKAQLDGE